MESLKKIDLLIIEMQERKILTGAVNSFQSNAEIVRLEKWIKELKAIREQIRKDAI
jgi:hypothetical protein